MRGGEVGKTVWGGIIGEKLGVKKEVAEVKGGGDRESEKRGNRGWRTGEFRGGKVG